MPESSEPGREEVAALVAACLAEVLALDPGDIRPSARFDEDLAADSLDVIEMLEGVERGLRGRGVRVSLPDEEVARLRTVRDAVDRVHAHATGQGVRP